MGDTIELADLPPAVRDFVPDPARPLRDNLPAGGLDLEAMISDIEQEYIRQALERAHYSQLKAASLLGLNARSLRYRLQKYGINAD
jgi:transcriptional regulator with GAF, ATPase, and Fis domain